ncbi:outer membrane beta-barrel protein [Aquabacterium fontiphilum]|jgi:hypothetical protein|uniref:outer membrane beta-barrel protein n=1 Tax=Aquabacterium fontiphilum TaxID=450365 RepID=UPI0013783F81|nr:outer membrane beta-barrel protein [Aquabacterium fontiphilum]NBD21665.1 outer membrane beta-barrel protein [Aquabacterium fontiphilum]
MSAQRIALATLVALSLGSSAFAQTQTGHSDGLRLRPMLGIGYTWGGDTITPVTVYDLDDGKKMYDTDVDAGAGLDLRAGVELSHPGSPFSLQLALAFHVDGYGGKNGAAGEFRRIPLEAVLRWRAADRVQLGFGVRKAAYSAFRVNDESCPEEECGGGGRIHYRSNVGLVLEAEYALTPDWGLRARYVRETYKVSKEDASLTANFPWAEKGYKVRGDHFGLMSVWYFR